MKNRFIFRIIIACFYLFMSVLGVYTFALAQDRNITTGLAEETPAVLQEAAVPVTETVAVSPGIMTESTLGNITLDFKDADIRSVLKIISLKAGVNIVASPDVQGTVTIYLDNVPWEKALDVILKTYGYGYEKRGNVISVGELTKLTEQKKLESELAQVQPTITEVFKLEYIDALDAKKALDPLISKRGKITILEMTGKSGWQFGTKDMSKREVNKGARTSLSKDLLITDIPPVIDEVRNVLKSIDVKPKQIMIETKIIEVSRDYLQDIGIEYATGTVANPGTIGVDGGNTASGQVITSTAGVPLTPSNFLPDTTGLTPETAGMKLVFNKLTGSNLQVILRLLEEDVNSNLLSAPRVMTIDNQEATILVGEKYPILSTNVAGTDTTTTTTSLDYYQDIGIQLNVVPQVVGDNKINMIVHPAVTSFSLTVGTNAYPRINTREAETQVLINDGETIVIAGLIKDYETKSVIGVPILDKIPFIGKFFRRDTKNNKKIELLIFITASIIKDTGLSEKDVSSLQKQVSVEAK